MTAENTTDADAATPDSESAPAWGTTAFEPGDDVGLISRLTIGLIERDNPSTRERLWGLVSDDAPLDDILDELSSTGLKALPDFGLAQVEGSAVRIVARGRTTIAAELASGSVREIDPSGVRTWIEELVRDVVSITITMPPLDGDRATPSGEEFAVLAGSVPASSLQRRYDVADDHADLAESAAGWSAGGTEARQGNDRPPVVDAPAPPAPAGARPASPQPPPPGASPASGPPGGPAAGGPPPNVMPPESSVMPSDSSVMSGTDSSVMSGTDDALVRGSDTAIFDNDLDGDLGLDVDVDDDVDDDGDEHDDDADGDELADDLAVDFADDFGDDFGDDFADGLDERAAGLVTAVMPGTEATASEVAPVYGVLSFSDGEQVDIDRTILIGRNPKVTGAIEGGHPHIMKFDGRGQGLSRTHAEVRVEGGAVVIEDLQSTNGTEVQLPGQQRRRLRGGEPVVIVVGTLIDFGDELTCTFESAG